MLTLTTFIQHSIRSPSTTISTAREEIKSIQTKKKKVKLSLFTDGMILYTENPKDSTKKTVKINVFRKVAGYKGGEKQIAEQRRGRVRKGHVCKEPMDKKQKGRGED